MRVMHEYTERNTHTQQHQMEKAARAGPRWVIIPSPTQRDWWRYVMQAAKGEAELANYPTTKGSRRWCLLLMEGVCTPSLLLETAGACQLPQPWDDPRKPLKGKRESATSLVMADGSSLTVLRCGEDAGRRGAGVATGLGIRKEMGGSLLRPPAPPSSETTDHLLQPRHTRHAALPTVNVPQVHTSPLGLGIRLGPPLTIGTPNTPHFPKPGGARGSCKNN